MPPPPAAAAVARMDRPRREHSDGFPRAARHTTLSSGCDRGYRGHVERTRLVPARGDDRPLPSNRPYVTGAEADLVRDALEQGSIDGMESCGARSEALLEDLLGANPRAFLPPSCRAALEMAAMLIGTGAGSEVIVPSFTFVSTANAFARQGATPVFVDIDPETLTLDPAAVEAAITPTTAAIVPVHYAGGACRMDAILEIAQRHDLVVVEDAAHCIGASLDGRALGTIGTLGTLSFHHTKNVSSGEGGALLINAQR